VIVPKAGKAGGYRNPVLIRSNVFMKQPVKGMFTASEIQIIKGICQQLTSEEISVRLGLSRRTVEDYRRNIQAKMGVKNSVGLALFAVRKGIVKL
jgi:DNA-binding CsgD family transcriptional regulator